MTARASDRSFGPDQADKFRAPIWASEEITMATVVETHTDSRIAVSNAPQAADVFVAFGITGDLAKVMTFRSLYRLERRGLLNCPVVGVSVDAWSVEHLREHAREGIAG